MSIFERLFSKRRAPRTDDSATEGGPVLPVAPPTSGVPPVLPTDRPVVDEAGTQRVEDTQTERETGQ